jgi:hypothetical protein
VKEVSILFARADSVYKNLQGCDVWDVVRDARNWRGGCPVVAHPPCRAWGRLRHFARPIAGEIELGPWAVEQVRKWGGASWNIRQGVAYGYRDFPIRVKSMNSGVGLFQSCNFGLGIAARRLPGSTLLALSQVISLRCHSHWGRQRMSFRAESG